MQFPIPTSKKPDMFIVCIERKIKSIIELTVPNEDNNDAAQLWTDEGYEGLVKDCENSGWEVVHFPVELGCRGFASLRMKGWLLRLGLSHRKMNKISKYIQLTVEKASHWIWLILLISGDSLTFRYSTDR